MANNSFSKGFLKSATEAFGAVFESELGRENGKPVSWEGIRKGDKLNSVKKLLKQRKSDENLPKLLNSKDPMYKRVEEFITSKGIVSAAEGRRVNLANPDSWEGQPPTIRQRALHLITGKANKNNLAVRIAAPERYPFVAAIPQTLSDPDLLATGKFNFQDRLYYFRKYKQGLHMVVTDKAGKIIEQGDADGLLTQYSPDLSGTKTDNAFKTFTVAYKKGDSVPETATSVSNPYPAYSDISATAPRITSPAEHTAALTNPAGVALPKDQTEGVPNNGTISDNIENFEWKNKGLAQKIFAALTGFYIIALAKN
ncbi:MAG: hypothetical protein FWB90_05055 [Fibromonadales bacterium]|nr:hypothetical protein [Fibromonadales bacterium]